MPRARLTHKSIENFKPPVEGRIEYWDSALPGFGLRITSNGAKSWVLMYRFGRRSRRLTIGQYPALGLADARTKAQTALQLVDREIDPGTEHIAARKADTFQELANEFLEKHAKQKNRRWKETDRIIKRELLPKWKGLKANAVRRRDVNALIDDIVTRGKPMMANGTLAVVRKMYNWAISRDIVDTSPCMGVRKPTIPVSRERVLSKTEIMQFWKAVDITNMSPLIRTALRLQLTTAQRIGEIVSMRWTDINFEETIWTIPAEISKNKRAHRVPLSRLALDLISAIPRIQGCIWMFPSPRPNQHIGADAPAHALKKNKAKIKIENFRPHDLRRTAATGIASLGTNRLVISKILNHTDRTVTAVYDQHDYETEKREALERWAESLRSILKTDKPKSGLDP